MPDNFINPLATARDHWFFGGHCLQINTAQTLIPAGQSEKYAAAHGLSNLLSTLTAEEANLLRNIPVAGQPGQAGMFRAISNNLAGDLRITWKDGREGSQKYFVAFDRNKVGDTEDAVGNGIV